MARLIKRLESRYTLVLPTAIRVRKIGSTTVALNVGEGAEASMITCQLSHTAKTDKLHLSAIPIQHGHFKVWRLSGRKR